MELLKNLLKNKKILGSIIVVILLLVAIILTSSRKQAANKNPNTVKIANEILGISMNYPALSQDKSDIYFINEPDKSISKFSIETKVIESIMNYDATNVFSAAWSKDRSKVILGLAKNKNQAFSFTYALADLKSNALVYLPNKTINNVIWSPDAKQIAFTYPSDSGDDFYLNISDPNGENWKNVFTIKSWGVEPKLFWTKQDEIIVFRPYVVFPEESAATDDLSKGFILNVNPQTKQFQNLQISDATDASFSQNGKFMAYVENESVNQFKIFDGKNSRTVKLPITSMESLNWTEDDNKLYILNSQIEKNNFNTLVLSSIDLNNFQVTKLKTINIDKKNKNAIFSQYLMINDKLKIAAFIDKNTLYLMNL